MHASWSDSRKSFCWGWRLRICKTFEMTIKNKFITKVLDFFNLLLEVSIRSKTLEKIKKTIGTNNWDVETYRNQLENTPYFNFRPHFLFVFRFQILTILLHSISLYILNNFMKEKVTLRTVSRQWFMVPQVANWCFSELSGLLCCLRSYFWGECPYKSFQVIEHFQ